MNIQSPLDPNRGPVKLIDTFDAEAIVESYKHLNIEVSRFFKDEKIYLYECLRTKYRFYHPYEIIGDSEFYKDLSENRTSYYSERWEHKEALKYIDKDADVLEIGSGFGAFLKMLNSKTINASGIELNPTAVKRCKEEGLDVDEKFIEDVAAENSKRYDVVCCFQVLEHITTVYEFLNAAVIALETGGKFIIGVPNNNPYLFRYDKLHTLNLPPHHAGLWNKKSLTALTKIFPLKVEDVLFEPIAVTYDTFLNVQLRHAKYFLEKITFKVLHKFMPNILRRLVCRFYKGRNILVVYKKT